MSDRQCRAEIAVKTPGVSKFWWPKKRCPNAATMYHFSDDGERIMRYCGVHKGKGHYTPVADEDLYEDEVEVLIEVLKQRVVVCQEMSDGWLANKADAHRRLRCFEAALAALRPTTPEATNAE